MVACEPHAALSVEYRRRQPDKTTLYQAVAEHWPAFVAANDEAERPMPKFVRREFERFLDCGVIENGAVRVRCPACGFDRLVAFSCKGRSGYAKVVRQDACSTWPRTYATTSSPRSRYANG